MLIEKQGILIKIIRSVRFVLTKNLIKVLRLVFEAAHGHLRRPLHEPFLNVNDFLSCGSSFNNKVSTQKLKNQKDLF